MINRYKKISLISIIIVLTFIFSSNLYCQSITNGIPDSILNNSHLIVLNEKFDFTIIDKKRTIIEVERNYIVLKKSKHVKSELTVFYNKFVKVSKANVRIYDKNNKLIRKYKHSKFNRQLLLGGGVSGDAGVEYLQLPDLEPPYRVEFYYKQKSNFSMFYPEWRPLEDEYQSLITSTLTVHDKTKNNLRYIGYNIGKPTVVKGDKFTQYKWELKNIKSVRYEKFNSRSKDYLPIVSLAAKEFEIDGYSGSMSDWSSIGKWVNKINEGRNIFKNDQLIEIKSIVNDSDTKLEKVRKVYKYLQENTRYASIQLGIGGWMPFKASFVHEKKYGDCKALTFYTKSMLDVLDIQSYYTLVRAGNSASEVQKDFPNVGFNHAFLMVPIDMDTIWLECTSQISPFGYLGSFTDDRYVLVTKETGGELVRSKKFGHTENINQINTDININNEGGASVLLQNKMLGLAIDREHFIYYANDRQDEQKKWLLNQFDFGGVNIDKFKIFPISDSIIPESGFEVEMLISDFASVVGNNLIFKLYVFNKLPYDKIISKLRIHDFYIRRSFTQKDNIRINLPSDYKYNKDLKPFELNTEFGKYSISVAKEKNALIFKRMLIINAGEYSKSKFKAFKSFVNTIIKKDNQKILVEK